MSVSAQVLAQYGVTVDGRSVPCVKLRLNGRVVANVRSDSALLTAKRGRHKNAVVEVPAVH
jgi:hypothetical protein